MTYRIEYLPAAVKDLRKLDKSVARRIVRKLTEVETDPYAFATTELVDRPGVRRLKIGVVAMAVVACLTVVSGTWIVYPWYREDTPSSAKSELLADASTADWHDFAMEWKEHIAWISPILATIVAFIVLYYGTNLIRHDRVRRTAMLLFVLAFVFAGVAGALGAFITKVAPVK